MATSFTPTCSLPPSGVHYVQGAPLRSTISILWNCLTIILLCTWNIQHLNVPPVRPFQAPKWKKLRWAILDVAEKAKWMIMTVLVPEVLVGKALSELGSAKESVKRMSHGRKSEETDWSLVHAYMANMGYFVLDSQLDDAAHLQGLRIENERNKDQSAFAKYKATHEPEKAGYRVKKNWARLQYRYLALDARQWGSVLEEDWADMPKIPERQLKKLDKGGGLVKALAVLQILYLVIQLVARKVGGLPASQLEIATLAFAVSSLLTYGLYWSRPQGVDTIYVVKSKRILSPDALSQMYSTLAYRGPMYLWYPEGVEFDRESAPAPIPNFAVDRAQRRLFQLGASVGGTVFGAVHCLAWDFAFPTGGEKLGWNICAVATAVLPLVMALPLLLSAYTVFERTRFFALAMRISTFVFVLLSLAYVLARLFLLAETVRSLFYLPPEAFVETWSGSFPHWG